MVRRTKSNRFQEYSEANQLMSGLDQKDRLAEYDAAMAEPGASKIWEDIKYSVSWQVMLPPVWRQIQLWRVILSLKTSGH